MDEFPNNSFITKRIKASEPANLKPERKQFEKVVTGKVARSKTTIGSRVKDLFVKDGTQWADYLIKEIVVPRLKDAFVRSAKESSAALGEIIEQIVYGDERPRTPSRRTSGPIPYNQYGNRPTTETARRAPIRRQSVRRSNQVDGILLENRSAGDDVLAHLEGAIELDGFCTVADYYSLVGETPSSTDTEWGWDNLSSAKVVMTRDGFLLKMPEPEYLRN